MANGKLNSRLWEGEGRGPGDINLSLPVPFADCFSLSSEIPTPVLFLLKMSHTVYKIFSQFLPVTANLGNPTFCPNFLSQFSLSPAQGKTNIFLYETEIFRNNWDCKCGLLFIYYVFLFQDYEAASDSFQKCLAIEKNQPTAMLYNGLSLYHRGRVKVNNCYLALWLHLRVR